MKKVLILSALMILASLVAGNYWVTSIISSDDEVLLGELATLVPTEEELSARFGSSPLNHSETRKAYREGLQWGREMLTQRQGQNGIADAQSRAIQCHLFRWRLRIWARNRDNDSIRLFGLPLLPAQLTSTLLGIRDIAVHGSLSNFVTSPFLVLRSVVACLMQDPRLPFCPSIDTLLDRHQGNWEEVEKGCWKSNSKWN